MIAFELHAGMVFSDFRKAAVWEKRTVHAAGMGSPGMRKVDLVSAENQGNVELFLQMHPDFELTPFSVGELFVNDGYVTLMPDEYPTDGFFIAKFTRK